MITNNEIINSSFLSSLVYNNDTLPYSKLGLQKIKVINNNSSGTYGIILADHINMMLYIVFRGTEDKKDFLIDLECIQETVVINGKQCGVHKGFWKAYTSIKDQIDSTNFEDFKGYEIITCGHSLGGALATICGSCLITTNKIYTITFGSPRVGNNKFCNAFNRNVSLYYRFIHNNDIVPQIPKINYNHAGKEIRLDDNGKEIPYYNLWNRLLYWIKGKRKLNLELVSLQDHFMNKYIHCISLWCN